MSSDATRPEDEHRSPSLVSLAQGFGISTEYYSFFGDLVQVPAATLRSVLSAMGVATFTDAQIEQALAERDLAPWRALVPPSLVVREASPAQVLVHVADRHDVALHVELEDGSRRDLAIADQEPQQREIDGVSVWRLEVALPEDLPLGWHAIVAQQRTQGEGGVDRDARCVLAVTPARLEVGGLRPGYGGRGWGLMAQLYSVRSKASWGIGDFADLADLVDIGGNRGADFLLINPIHAGEPAGHIEPSPYLPATRRFVSPLYIRPEDIREAAYLPSSQRALIEWSHDSVRPSNTDPERIDRDAAWAAKKAALEVLFKAPKSAARQRSYTEFVTREGRALADFALWCSIAEHFEGTSAWRSTPGCSGLLMSSWAQRRRPRLLPACRSVSCTTLPWAFTPRARMPGHFAGCTPRESRWGPRLTCTTSRVRTGPSPHGVPMRSRARPTRRCET